MIKSSELIINADGSIFSPSFKARTNSRQHHIGWRSEASWINRQIVNRHRMQTCKTANLYPQPANTIINALPLFQPIGTDNIDIVVNELDALANIDFVTREIKPDHRKLNFVRIGTSGGIAGLSFGKFICSVRKSDRVRRFAELLRQPRSGFRSGLRKSILRAHTNWAGESLRRMWLIALKTLFKRDSSYRNRCRSYYICTRFLRTTRTGFAFAACQPKSERINRIVWIRRTCTINFEMECSAI